MDTVKFEFVGYDDKSNKAIVKFHNNGQSVLFFLTQTIESILDINDDPSAFDETILVLLVTAACGRLLPHEYNDFMGEDSLNEKAYQKCIDYLFKFALIFGENTDYVLDEAFHNEQLAFIPIYVKECEAWMD